ncbi:MFS transporter [Actinomadura flavalba]|uniref:MFS transporter n=1 Tax=Actinomadura flavalba TaxID=1120938 RepID=UPI00037E1AB7|nr:MFS transporter [Actinomadura flavalba]
MSPPASARPASTLVLAVIVSCELALMLDATIMNVALPAVRDGLGFTPAGLSWVSTAFLLAFGGLLLLGGRAGDVFGRRRVFLAGMAVFTLASLLGGLAPGPGWLVAARALQGAGAALAGPATLALLVTHFTGERQARALGVYSAVTASAMTLGLVLGGLITAALSWRWVLFVNVPLGLFVLAVAPRRLGETPRSPGRFDVAGGLTSVAGLVALTFGLARAEHGWSDPLAVSGLAVGAALLAVFVLVERRAARPVLPPSLFADRARAGALAALLLVPMVTMSAQFLLVQYFQEVAGFGSLRSGLAFLPMAAGMFATARHAPAAVTRLGGRVVALGGIASMAAALGWLVPLSDGYWLGAAGPLLLLGAGLGYVVVPLNMAIMATVDPAEAGAASGVLQAAMLTGASLGVAVLSAVRVSAGGPALPGGLGAAFATGLGVLAVAFLVVLATLRGRDGGAISTPEPESATPAPHPS